jgi:NTE family protein
MGPTEPRTAPVDDGLARPISFAASYGAGCRRALVLGGGGLAFVAWLTGYVGELAQRGVDVADADRIVGTSAGSLLAGVIAAGRQRRFRRLVRLLAERPGLIGVLSGAGRLEPSQQRARDLFEDAHDAEPETVRAIGAAALAAATPGRLLLPASEMLVTQIWHWPPDDRLIVTAVDAYTGERLALTRASGVPVLRAIAASAALPGLFAPQPLLDRRCIDGGVAGTGIHADLVAGAERALVLSFAETLPEARFTVGRDSTEREIAALRASGTAVAVCSSRLSPVEDQMDPRAVPAALALGISQAAEDAPELAAFWGG